MNNRFFTTIAAMVMTLFLVTACADESKNNEATTQAEDPAEQAKDSIWDQPVDFSTTEAAEKTLQRIREQEGENAHKAITNAFNYLLYYDLEIRNDKEKLYKKLDGKTPREIIEMGRR